MTIAYKLIRESFTTKVVLDRQALTIRAEYLDGPFSYLENVWRFEPHGRGDCIVHFTIDYAVPLDGARAGDGRGLRPGVPQVHRGLRGARRRRLRCGGVGSADEGRVSR